MITTTKIWAERAACRGLDPDVFQANRGDNKKIRRAKDICEQCPVIMECREYSFHLAETFDTYGVFGGLSRNERINHLRNIGVSVRRFGGTEPATNIGSSLRDFGHGTATAVRRHKFNSEPLCAECVAGAERRHTLKTLASRRAAVRKRTMKETA